MNKWKEYKLRDAPLEIIDGDRGKNYPPQDEFSATGYCLFLSTKNVRATGFDFSDCQFISKQRDELLRKGNLARNDIVLTTRGTIGNIGFYSSNVKFDRIRINSGMLIIRPNPNELLPSFNYYLFRYLQRDFSTFTSGSAQPQLPIKDLHEIGIKLPELHEQIQIVSILGSVDDKIYILHRQNNTLESLAEILFRQWFVEEQQDAWEVTTLVNHTEVFRGLSYHGAGLTVKNIGLPMHNLNSIHEGGGYKYEGIKYYKGDFKDRHLVRTGDIIIANTEQGHEYKLIGYPAIVPSSFGEKGLFSQHIYKLNLLSQTYLSKEFIYYLLKTSYVREQIIAATNGSTVNMLAIDGLQRPVFKLPPKEKVFEFTSIVRGFWLKKKINDDQIRTLTQLRDTLLPKLMSGEVRVKES